MNDAGLMSMLAPLPPNARDVLRRAARAEQWERDDLAARLLREPKGQDLAELVDRLSLFDDARRQMVRLLGELEAAG